MAESVEEELRRKLIGAKDALKEVETYLSRYLQEKEILEKRVHDLNTALHAFKPVDASCNDANRY